MHAPVCGKCHVHMACTKNEVVVPHQGGWLKSGDQFTCCICGMTIVTGFGEPYRGIYADIQRDIASDERELIEDDEA